MKWTAKNKLQWKFYSTSNSAQNTITSIRHAYVIMHSAPVIPNWRATLPHVTRKVTENTRSSFLCMSERFQAQDHSQTTSAVFEHDKFLH